MRYTLVLITVLGFSTSAIAGSNDCEWSAPAKFDWQNDRTNAFKVERLSKWGVIDKCNTVMSKYNQPLWEKYGGCTDPEDRIIYVVKGSLGCVTEESILRHEYGHVNGWLPDHSN